jgi:heme-degrading monooxygenase HmoA
MLARVVIIQVRPEKMDECIRIFRERNAPSIAAQPGFHHGHWWVDRASGRATSVTFWENEADEQASRANIAGLVEWMADVLASDEVIQEISEVVHDQYPSGRRE